MKKTLLTIGVVAALFSCSKEDEITVLEATDLTGTAVVTGTISGDNPLNGWNTAGLEGVPVSIRVDNDQLYPNNSSAQGSEVYSGTTDAEGRYSISVTVNQEGSAANVTFGNKIIIDPANGYSYTFSDDNSSSGSYTLYANQNKVIDTEYDSDSNGNANTAPVGTGEVRGKVYIEKSIEWAAGVFKDTLYYLDNQNVTLVYDYDPTTRMPKTYTATTDANGDYSFTVDCVDNMYQFDDDYEITIPDMNATFDTIMMNGSTSTGPTGYFNDDTRNGSLDANQIINNQDLFYNNFIED
jgi:hypothetical protein